MTGLFQVYERNQTHFQIGDNTNLFDWTYVGNVARAHLLAADKLIPSSEDGLDLNSQLPSIDITTGKHRVPTSEARPLGPYVALAPNADKLLTAFNSSDPGSSNRPVIRSNFDQFSSDSLEKPSMQVAGQAFFITNGEPMYFWDMPRAVWSLLDVRLQCEKTKRSPIVMPRSIGLAAATAAEWWSWMVGKEPTFTRFKAAYSCASRWYNIEKARRILGYEPEVGIGEGIGRMVNVSFIYFACSLSGNG
jgi:sterol-4alpha-carboxylate 3-dehydrogenase (decarboxylating)